MRVFLSYKFQYEPFVRRVNYYLSSQPHIVPYCYAEEKKGGEWEPRVREALEKSKAFVLFVGRRLGETQFGEADLAMDLHGLCLVVVKLPNATPLPLNLSAFKKCDPVSVPSLEDGDAEQCAKDIARLLGHGWHPPYGVPIGYPFDYEKAIIQKYVEGKGRLSGKFLEQGCPAHWPSVSRLVIQKPRINPVPEQEIGNYREEKERIIADVRSRYHVPGRSSRHCLMEYLPETLTFLEAGPRRLLRYPVQPSALRVGIVTSGGIAPGINSVIAGVVERHVLYARKSAEQHSEEYHLAVYGYRDGLRSLIDPGRNYTVLTESEVRRQADQGGTILSTSRAEELLDSAAPTTRARTVDAILQKLRADAIEILYVIGGDGSMKAAHTIRRAAVARGMDLSVVAIPKTMDNDILWVWQSFGFLSAVEKAREFILQLHTEAQSNPRLCVVQLFGSDSGFVVSHAALASGVCDLALIPEVPFSMKRTSEYIRAKLRARFLPGEGGQSPYGVVVMSETAIPTDVEDYVDDPHVDLRAEEKQAIREFRKKSCRVNGQTPDELRTGGLKIVSRVLQRDIKENMKEDYWENFRVFTNEPRHLLRSIEPSVSDVIFGHRLGCLAVDNAMAGYTDFMVSQWLTEYVLVPLELVMLGRKRVPKDGIFWKTVLAGTGQPADLE